MFTLYTQSIWTEISKQALQILSRSSLISEGMLFANSHNHSCSENTNGLFPVPRWMSFIVDMVAEYLGWIRLLNLMAMMLHQVVHFICLCHAIWNECCVPVLITTFSPAPQWNASMGRSIRLHAFVHCHTKWWSMKILNVGHLCQVSWHRV